MNEYFWMHHLNNISPGNQRVNMLIPQIANKHPSKRAYLQRLHKPIERWIEQTPSYLEPDSNSCLILGAKCPSTVFVTAERSTSYCPAWSINAAHQMYVLLCWIQSLYGELCVRGGRFKPIKEEVGTSDSFVFFFCFFLIKCCSRCFLWKIPQAIQKNHKLCFCVKKKQVCDWVQLKAEKKVRFDRIELSVTRKCSRKLLIPVFVFVLGDSRTTSSQSTSLLKSAGLWCDSCADST